MIALIYIESGRIYPPYILYRTARTEYLSLGYTASPSPYLALPDGWSAALTVPYVTAAITVRACAGDFVLDFVLDSVLGRLAGSSQGRMVINGG
jgi:hypothetical protein